MRLLMLALCLTMQIGCASHFKRLEPIRQSYYSSRFQEARETIAKYSDKKPREADVLMLDQAMVELTAGNPKQAERLLRQVRNRFDELEQKDIREEASLLLTDDTARAYSGEDYERVLIRAFLAISNLMTDGGDAHAYALQVSDKQQQVINTVQAKNPDDEAATLAYKQVPLGPYLRAALAEESSLTLDEAVRARTLVAEWDPSFRDGQTDLQRVKHEVAMSPGHGVVYVFGMMGRGPIKEEESAIATQASLLIADRIVSAFTKRGLPPTLAPVKIPVVRTFYNPATSLSIQPIGHPAAQSATLVDIGRMAREQQDARQAEVIARAVVRRVVKKGAVYAAKEVTKVNSELNLLMDVAGVAWEATEKADTRCWGLLPNEIQVARLELPAGTHSITLQPMGANGPIGGAQTTDVKVREGRNVYVLVTCPERQIIGKILCSEPATLVNAAAPSGGAITADFP